MGSKRRILFLCTGNCIRSQMAEGLLRQLAGDRFESLSAGAHAAGWIDPLTVQVMEEAGIDISEARSKSIDEFLPRSGGRSPEMLISLCDAAAADCPAFPKEVERCHWSVYDPIRFVGSEEETLAVFRQVRNELRARIEQALDAGEL